MERNKCPYGGTRSSKKYNRRNCYATLSDEKRKKYVPKEDKLIET